MPTSRRQPLEATTQTQRRTSDCDAWAHCGGQMRLIAFVTEGTQIEKILNHIGVDSEPPHIAPARGSPLWDGCDAQIGEGVEIEPDWDQAAQPAILNRCGMALRPLHAAHRTAPQITLLNTKPWW